VSDLKLTDTSGQLVAQSSGAAVRFGRDPDSSVVVRGEAARVASVRHAELRLENGTWLLADLASKNGTFLNGTRVSTPTPVKQGDMIRLGESGPEYRVGMIVGQLEETLAEHPGVQVPSREAEQRAYGVTLLVTATGRRFEARGTWIRLGRGRECEVQPVESNDTTVSRVHAELTVGAGGGLVVRDAESKNGTYLNGERIAKTMPIRLGDKIMLGQGGPVLLIEGMGTASQKAVPRPQAGAGGGAGIGQKTVIGMIGNALAKAKDEVGKDARGKIRWLTGFVIVLVVLLGGGVYGVYWLLSRQVEHTERDTVWVTMADQASGRYADVVATSRERDVALVKIRGYQGSYLTAIDWAGTRARQGEPAALIGYPAGSGFARDRTSIVRTSMTAGILSRVTADLIQFDGMTTGGSSGSPVFNADGDVISVHRAGLRQGPGFALSVPVKFAIPLMPPALRQRLGV